MILVDTDTVARKNRLTWRLFVRILVDMDTVAKRDRSTWRLWLRKVGPHGDLLSGTG